MNRFERNMTALSLRDPALVAAVRAAGGGVLTIGESKAGVPTASVGGRAVHSTYDPVREASDWANQQVAACRAEEAVVVFGVGLLYHVEALAHRVPPETALAVVVSDVRELHDACMARSLEGWSERILWVWGATDRMVEQIRGMGRPLRMVSYAAAARLHAERHADVDEQLRRMVASTMHGRVHVAVVGPIYGGSLPIARYVVSALEGLGHRVTWIDHSVQEAGYEAFGRLKDSRHRLTLQTRFGELLGQATVAHVAEDPPDLVLALAQAPLSLPVLDLLRRKRFLTAMWFVENYRHLTYWRQVAGGYDHWFVIQNGPCHDALRAAGAGDVCYLPMAADPAVHRPMTLSPEEMREFSADVAFVGAGYANRRDMLARLILKDWTFKLWGNEWDGAASLKAVLQREGARIDTDTCVKVFNATKVNLNLHSWTGRGLDPMPDFVNPRTFEIAASGAFQVVDNRAPLAQLFHEHEMATFRTEESCVTAVRAWLCDRDGRLACAAAARRRVLAEHTYGHRMASLLSHVGVRQPDRLGSILRGERLAAALTPRAVASPTLKRLLERYAGQDRVELPDLAAQIRRRGPSAVLDRDEILILLLDEYRKETRDLV